MSAHTCDRTPWDCRRCDLMEAAEDALMDEPRAEVDQADA